MTITKPFKPVDTPLVNSEMGNLGIHTEQVFQWRAGRFEWMGFNEDQADYLASRRVDLHEMEMLLEAGCSHEHAIRILADTCWSGEDTTDYTYLASVAFTEPPEGS